MSGLFNGSANFKLEQYKVERDDTEKFMKTGVEELRLAEEEKIRDAEMARKRCNVHNFTELNMKSNVKTLLQKSGGFVMLRWLDIVFHFSKHMKQILF